LFECALEAPTCGRDRALRPYEELYVYAVGSTRSLHREPCARRAERTRRGAVTEALQIFGGERARCGKLQRYGHRAAMLAHLDLGAGQHAIGNAVELAGVVAQVEMHDAYPRQH